jgi:hypothetical protein
MSNGGKTWWIEIIIFVICSVILIALFEISRNLFNYLRSTLMSSVDYRTAFAFAILYSTISSMIYYYLVKRWLRLEVWQSIFRFVYFWSITTLFTTLFFIDNVELAFQAAQIVAATFFGGLMIAILMIINSMTNTQRTSPVQPPQANPPLQPSPVQLQTLSQTSLFPLPQPGQQVIVEIQGNRIVLTVQNNRQEVSAQT